MSADWSPFDDDAEPVDAATRANTASVFAAVFKTAGGSFVLEHLERMTLGRVMRPTDSDAALRQMEGQRQIVHYIRALIAQAERRN